MQDQYTISEAKNKLPAIIHSVEKGLSVQLTRRARPVAVLISVEEYEKLRGNDPDFWKALNAFRQKMEEDRFDILEGDFEDLRDSSTGREVDFSS